MYIYITFFLIYFLYKEPGIPAFRRLGQQKYLAGYLAGPGILVALQRFDPHSVPEFAFFSTFFLYVPIEYSDCFLSFF